MIVGFMAFMLKVIVNAQKNINHDWYPITRSHLFTNLLIILPLYRYSAIEFADLIIPITSMIYLSIGTLLM